MKPNRYGPNNAFSRIELTLDTQEVADSSSAEPTTTPLIPFSCTKNSDNSKPPFDRLIHPKTRRIGRHLVGRRAA
jgi:hypothetical protein